MCEVKLTLVIWQKKNIWLKTLQRNIWLTDITSSNVEAMMSLDNNVVLVTSYGHFAMFVLIEV